MSNAELTPGHCEQVRTRVREFTEYVAKGFSCVQREMAAQMLQLFGIEPTDALSGWGSARVVPQLDNCVLPSHFCFPRLCGFSKTT